MSSAGPSGESANALVGRVQRKPGPKETKEVIEGRIAEIIRILESCGWTKNIESRLADQWEVGARQVRRLKQRAAKRVAIAVAPGALEEERAAHLSQVRALRALAVEKGDLRTAANVLRWEGQILGLEQPKKIEVSGDLRGLSEAELDARAAKLRAAEGVTS